MSNPLSFGLSLYIHKNLFQYVTEQFIWSHLRIFFLQLSYLQLVWIPQVFEHTQQQQTMLDGFYGIQAEVSMGEWHMTGPLTWTCWGAQTHGGDHGHWSGRSFFSCSFFYFPCNGVGSGNADRQQDGRPHPASAQVMWLVSGSVGLTTGGCDIASWILTFNNDISKHEQTCNRANDRQHGTM